MSSINCTQCGAPVHDGATSCKYCGEPVSVVKNQEAAQVAQQPIIIQQPIYTQAPTNSQYEYNPNWPIKNKIAAGLLAIFLGSLGIHKFYLGKGGQGVLHLIFFWTYIPGIIGLIEGIIYLTSSDHVFCMKNQVRLE